MLYQPIRENLLLGKTLIMVILSSEYTICSHCNSFFDFVFMIKTNKGRCQSS